MSAAWDAALLTNDASAFAGFATDDWVFVSPAGLTPRSDIVDWIATGRLAHHTMRTIGAPRVIELGGTVIVTARKASSGTWDGVPYTADEFISEVYVRRDRRWWCVVSHKSPVER